MREQEEHQAEGTASTITQRRQSNFGHSKRGKGQGDGVERSAGVMCGTRPMTQAEARHTGNRMPCSSLGSIPRAMGSY